MNTKRKGSKILTALLALCMLFALLPNAALAASLPEEADFELKFRKTVQQIGGAAPGAETFSYEIADEVQDSGKTLADYGITLNDGKPLTVETTGTMDEDLKESVTKTFTGKLVTAKATEENGWAAPNTYGNLTKRFTLKEKVSGKPGWTFDPTKYTVIFSYNPNSGRFYAEVFTTGDVDFTIVEFRSTYSAIELKLKKTVEQKGTLAPAARTFAFNAVNEAGKSFADCGVLLDGALAVDTTGAGTFNKTLIATVDGSKVTEENGWTEKNSYFLNAFTITEPNDNAGGWTYSEKKFSLEVSYSPRTGGVFMRLLDLDAAGDAATRSAVEFTNSYDKEPEPTTPPTTPPTEPEPTTPPTTPSTGDTGNVMLWIALLFVSGAGVFGSLTYSRKKKERA